MNMVSPDQVAAEIDRDTGLPIGPLVEWRDARRPTPVTLAGRWVTLVPLDPRAHAADLYDATAGREHDALWRYLPYGPYPDRAAFAEDIANKSRSTDPVFFAIMNAATRRPVGYGSLLRIEPEHGCIEIGHILYTPDLQRTPGATEAMYLMAKHVFEDLGYRRYEWKCDALNGPSRRAALRLGFTFEGVFRHHRIVKGRNRDTAWYAMLDAEWPAHRSAFERWLDPANLDAHGHQRRSLSECRQSEVA